MDMREFASRCQYSLRDGKLHGKCKIALPNGQVICISTAEGEGVDIPSVAHAIAKREAAEVGGFFGSAWKRAKAAAKAVAKPAVARKLLIKSQAVIARANKLAQTPEMRTALQYVPGGQYVALGTKAATLIQNAKLGDPKAKRRIKGIAVAARQGHPGAQKALRVLSNVNKVGKAKGAWASPRRNGNGNGRSNGRPAMRAAEPGYTWMKVPNRMRGLLWDAEVAGWRYNKPYRGIAFDTPGVKMRYLYAQGVNS